MINWAQILTIANLIVLLMTAGGGYLVLKSTVAKAESDVQERVRGALHDENELLQSQVERQGKEIKRLNAVLEIIFHWLRKSQNIEIEVDGDIVTFRGASGVQVSRITANEP